MKNILLFLTYAFACKQFALAQEPVQFKPPVYKAETKVNVSTDKGYSVSTEIYKNSVWVGKTDRDGWITIPELHKGDTIRFGTTDFTPKQYVIPEEPHPVQPMYIKLNEPYLKPVKAEPQHTAIEESASFPGGQKALMKYLSENLVYPLTAIETGLQGKCYVRFIVDVDGTISEPTIIKGVPNCPECDAEVVRLVNNMPKWVPAKKINKELQLMEPVKSFFTLPITFALQ